MKKVVKKLIIISLVIIALVFVYNKEVIFQEGNPIPIWKSIFKLEVNDDSFYPVSNSNMLVTKSSQKSKPIINLMSDMNYRFVEQFGSVLIFKNDEQNRKVSISSKQYTRHYIIWKSNLFEE